MKRIKSQIINEYNEECFGPWGNFIVLSVNIHQEHFADIKELIWRMFVSYQKLNIFTKYYG